MHLNLIKCAFAFCCVSLLAVGCSKDDAGTSVGTTVNFSPLTAASTWTYLNTPGSTFTLTATNRDTAVNGKTYRVLTNSAGSNIYLNKTGSNYYRFGAVAELNIQAAEELYLMDDKAVNETWQLSQSFTLPGAPIPITANLNYSIKEKGVTRTVSGIVFKNVTRVRLDLSVAIFGAIGGGDFYYAEGIGLIENSILLNVPGQAPVNQTQVITQYSIK